MKAVTLATIALALLPTVSFGAAQQKAKAASPAYVCQKCHMHFSAAQAKKDHYKDPMDGGILLPMKAATGKKTAPMKGIKM